MMSDERKAHPFKQRLEQVGFRGSEFHELKASQAHGIVEDVGHGVPRFCLK
jgi:hypothetical protein